MTERADLVAPRARRVVFYSVAAQSDNLGDIEIRSTALSWIRELNTEVVIFTGNMPRDYLQAFEVDSHIRWVPSSVRYQAVLWSKILTRRASIVFAPGPQVFSQRWRSMAKSLINLANVVGVRASGGAAVAVGRSLRGNGRLARLLELALISRFQLFVVRDTRSAEVLGRALEDAPDLAFAHRGDTWARVRNRVAISLRSDRQIDVQGLRSLVKILKAAGIEPFFVSQVRRDDSQHLALSRELGLSAVLWGDESHADQLVRARDAYAGALAVISNRLHALILGMQQGATPIGVLDEGSDKLSSTLGKWVSLPMTSSGFGTVDGREWTADAVRGDREALRQELREAEAVLESVKSRFVQLLHGIALPVEQPNNSEVWVK